jgi:murein L,D-transpeptidase YcbB/YkuD
MPVIVGNNYRETPVFSDVITYIEFNPFWNIPPTIARDDILPRLKKDPAWLSTMGIHVFDGWKADSVELFPETIQWDSISKSRMAAFKLRQDPGPNNFLGRVKFMFPNRFAVYLHDTPAQELFQRTIRTFSSGCIRLSKPLELAALLLEPDNNGWNPDKIRRTVDGGIRTVVKLKSPLPIHIVYLTAYTDSEGCVCFKKDIYGRDELLVKALFGSTS